METSDILQNELKGSFDFFYNYTNLNSNNKGFGLTVDSSRSPNVASIASVGFALKAWVIASERGFISYQKALEITRGTLSTLCYQANHYRGFFAHFLWMENGQRYKKSEFSTIDTSLCLNGVITAAAYFQDEEVQQMAQLLLDRVDWNFLVFEEDAKTRFRMAYNPDRDGDYVTDQPGLFGQWDKAAEQKMMYLQAAAQIEPALAMRLYEGFSRDAGYYDGHKIIVNPGGNLFAYQFSEAWLDTGRYLDPDGIDWFNNTRLAALANRSFCIQHSTDFKTYQANSWGASAGDSPWGYDVSGSTPSLHPPKPNGTVSIYSALACLPFIPELTIDLIQHLYHHHPQTWGPYGFYDSYNLAVNPPWYSNTLIGIDKGCSMIMIENHLSRLIGIFIQTALLFKNRWPF
ncbi:MAG TPA: glucoamylase family protein [Longilinea sp.]|nr:glucoamylase family protein [Longilinea sp.]